MVRSCAGGRWVVDSMVHTAECYAWYVLLHANLLVAGL